MARLATYPDRTPMTENVCPRCGNLHPLAEPTSGTVEVPTERDMFGQVKETVRTTPEAADHWDERKWRSH